MERTRELTLWERVRDDLYLLELIELPILSIGILLLLPLLVGCGPDYGWGTFANTIERSWL
jgi:hypothetical protein